MDRKKKNAGFSLVELLVAVTILAIITIPLMHAIVSSARTNAKAEKIAAITETAQNLMEEVLAMPMEKIAADGSPGAKINGVPNGYIYPAQGDKDAEDGGKLVTIAGKKYNVWAELHNYADETDNNELTDVNRKALAQIYDMNEKQDAFFIQDMEMDRKMAAKFSGDVALIEKEMRREIIIEIEKAGDEKKVQLDVSYQWDGNPGIVKYAFPQKRLIYCNDDAAEDLRNVYLFFQPLPEDSKLKEKIIIKNKDCLDVNVYLVRQTRETETDCGIGYGVEVDVLEPGRTGTDFAVDAAHLKKESLLVKTHIRTNLTYSTGIPADSQMALKYGTTDGVYDVEIPLTAEGKTENFTAADLTDYKDLAAQKAETRVYEVIVKVYEEGVDHEMESALVSLTGTKQE